VTFVTIAFVITGFTLSKAVEDAHNSEDVNSILTSSPEFRVLLENVEFVALKIAASFTNH
jgi:hypothetical protein